MILKVIVFFFFVAYVRGSNLPGTCVNVEITRGSAIADKTAHCQGRSVVNNGGCLV